MGELNPTEVEKVILDVISKVTEMDVSALSMDTPIADIQLKSIQIISLSALLEEKIGYAPNFRAIIGMEKLQDIKDYILR